jgi:molybdopterin molybdotransferase
LVFRVGVADVRMCGFERRLSVAQALARLDPWLKPLPSEEVTLEQAYGRVLARAVHAAHDVPHFARSMMDGYALVAESTFGASSYHPVALDVVGEAFAGHPAELSQPIVAGQAVRITTGAPVPTGADAVLMVEYTQGEPPRVEATESVSPGKHVGDIGEDIRRGEEVVAAGRQLLPQDLGVVASVGIDRMMVHRRPRVHIVVTGDELLPPGHAPTGAKIVDSNSVVLRALADRDGAASVEVSRLPDDAAVLAEVLASSTADVMLLAGGSSVGPEDHAPRLLDEAGELLVHGVAMRPSSPAGFGRVGERLVFLLPGNPVSCLCAYEFFAGPAVRALGGRPSAWPHPKVELPVARKLVSVLGRTDFMRVTLADDGVHPLMTSGASLLSSMTKADGVVIIDGAHEGHAPGERVVVRLFAHG